jgi:hypothetical protein
MESTKYRNKIFLLLTAKNKTSFSLTEKEVLASQERFELPTDGLEGRCSIQLSYWDMYFTLYSISHFHL